MQGRGSLAAVQCKGRGLLAEEFRALEKGSVRKQVRAPEKKRAEPWAPHFTPTAAPSLTLTSQHTRPLPHRWPLTACRAAHFVLSVTAVPSATLSQPFPAATQGLPEYTDQSRKGSRKSLEVSYFLRSKMALNETPIGLGEQSKARSPKLWHVSDPRPARERIAQIYYPVPRASLGSYSGNLHFFQLDRQQPWLRVG